MALFSLQLHAEDAALPYSADTLTVIANDIDEVQVVARLEQPTDTHKEIAGRVLNAGNTGQGLPYLLAQTPSLLFTSDDGLGVGYSYFRIRGTDQTRINMTVNGVPLNDGESQDVFWVNITDLASSLSSVNIQRGVGTSTNGTSFGAALNMSTQPESVSSPGSQETAKPHVELQFNGGSYCTFREMIKADVPLPRHWHLAARLSKLNSDGYLYRAKSDLFSYHTSLGYYGDNTTVTFNAFGGMEKTYMAWDGVSADDLQTDRRYNPAGAYYDAEGNLLYYPNQNDNYRQQHFQLHLSQRISPQWKFRAALHYTHGNGYYEQMKADKKYSSYGLENYVDGEGNTVKRSNFVRQKHLHNHFYGGLFSFDFRSEPADLSVGAASNQYLGNHWGLITDHSYASVTNHEFYRSTADKFNANVYAKTNWRVINKARRTLTLYADLQYIYIYYNLAGLNDEDLQPLYATRQYHFFNPKAGITYSDHNHLAYFNFAIAHREPPRKNFTDAGPNDIPEAERLYDYELGYSYNSGNFSAGVNLYFMYYRNQLVLTGKYSDTGAYLTRNVPRSYRAGIELTGRWHPVEWFEWNAALTLSRNRILNYTDWVTTYDMSWNELPQQEVNFGDVPISFSPAVTFANTFSFSYAGFRADILTQAVSKQYLDNTFSEEAILKPYTVTNLTLSYALPLPERWPGISVMAQANNIFNTSYESNGGSWMCMFTDGSRYYTPWYYAQAGINVHAGVKVFF